MMFRMPDKESHTVLITGASSGFGRRTAFTLARAGYRVYASMRDTAWKNRRAAEEIQAEAKAGELPIEVIDLDVAKPESVQSAVREIEGSGSTIDVLVNNAGHMSIGIAEAFTDEQVQQQLDVNFLGPVRLCRAVLPQMRERRSGLIIHISSIVGRVLFPACAFYCASKFALEAYAEVLHYELTSFGIDSVLIEPGPYPTQLLANSPGPADKDRVQTYGPFSSLREMFSDNFEKFFASDQAPNPQEIADAVLRLIQMPSGTRPLRTVCGPDYGALEINRQNMPIQAQVLRGIEMGMLADRAVVSSAS
jgi:NAD(P)-dependent dehydrogenase (short-subunit alcohol dehydrogenase family)